MADYLRAHGWISGHVQGVGFRFFARDLAHDYDLSGWVKNLPDGRVEFAVEGPGGLVNDFLKDIRRGPAVGFVKDLKVEWENYTGEFNGFRIRF
jgi:acylphosphatase